jgi:anti-sigma B factor antagonist
MTEDPVLTLQIEVQNDVTTVRCSGRLVSTNARRLQTNVKPLIRPSKTIVIDLTDLTFMDSMGLGTVASLYVSSQVVGGHLELVNLTRRIRDLLTTTHLLSLFEPCGKANVTIP